MRPSVLQLSAIDTVLLNRVFTMPNGTISSLKEQADFSQNPVSFIHIVPLADPAADTRVSRPWEHPCLGQAGLCPAGLGQPQGCHRFLCALGSFL